MYAKIALLALVGVAFVAAAFAQSPATADPSLRCSQFNNTNCSHCISEGNSNGNVDFRCYWCQSTMRCQPFNFNTIIPISGIDCPNVRYNVATCAIEVLFIIVIIAAACLLFVLLLCCCCCACCIICANRKRRKKVIEENRYLDEKDNIRQRSADRRADRKAKHDEIRRKYGLNAGEEGNYKRLD